MISWTDAQGRRRRRKTNAKTLFQARSARSAELLRVEQSKALGFAPPGHENMSDVAARFLSYQKARLTPKAYARERGIVNKHLSLFVGPIASIRRVIYPTLYHEAISGSLGTFCSKGTKRLEALASPCRGLGNRSVQRLTRSEMSSRSCWTDPLFATGGVAGRLGSISRMASTSHCPRCLYGHAPIRAFRIELAER